MMLCLSDELLNVYFLGWDQPPLLGRLTSTCWNSRILLAFMSIDSVPIIKKTHYQLETWYWDSSCDTPRTQTVFPSLRASRGTSRVFNTNIVGLHFGTFTFENRMSLFSASGALPLQGWDAIAICIHHLLLHNQIPQNLVAWNNSLCFWNLGWAQLVLPKGERCFGVGKKRRKVTSFDCWIYYIISLIPKR